MGASGWALGLTFVPGVKLKYYEIVLSAEYRIKCEYEHEYEYWHPNGQPNGPVKKKVRPAPEEQYFPGEGASGVWELACDRHDTPIKATKSGKKVDHL